MRDTPLLSMCTGSKLTGLITMTHTVLKLRNRLDAVTISKTIGYEKSLWHLVNETNGTEWKISTLQISPYHKNQRKLFLSSQSMIGPFWCAKICLVQKIVWIQYLSVDFFFKLKRIDCPTLKGSPNHCAFKITLPEAWRVVVHLWF